MCLKKITLTGDVMFVNKLPFFVTFGRDIGLLTVKFTPTRTAKQLGENLKNVIKLYGKAGYEVEMVIMDMEFNKMKTILPQLNINTSAAWEKWNNI